MNKLWQVTDDEDTYWVASPDVDGAEGAVRAHFKRRYGITDRALKTTLDPKPSKRWMLSRHTKPVILASTEESL